MYIQRTYDVAIIGGGVMGASISHALAGRGLRIALIEARYLSAGATGSSSAVVRAHYTNPHEARLALHSLQVFREWRERVGEECGYRGTGFLRIVAPRDADRLKQNVGWLRQLGARIELMDAHEIKAANPGFSRAGVGVAAFEPDGGHADASQTTAAFVRSAERHGAAILLGTPVHAILAGRTGVQGVDTAHGRLTAGAVVVAAGAWSSTLVERLGVHLPMRPKLIRAGFIRPRGVPPQLTVMDDSVGTYFRPEGRGTEFGLHYTWGVEPQEQPIQVPPGEIADGVRHIARRVPAFAEAGIVRGWGAVDGFSPDGAPLIGPVQEIPGLFVATACGGTGFKIAPAVGEAVADLIAPDRRDLMDVTAFRVDRFAQGAALTGENDYRRANWRHRPPRVGLI